MGSLIRQTGYMLNHISAVLINAPVRDVRCDLPMCQADMSIISKKEHGKAMPCAREYTDVNLPSRSACVHWASHSVALICRASIPAASQHPSNHTPAPSVLMVQSPQQLPLSGLAETPL